MRVYCDLPQPSLGLARIRDALIRYAPPAVQIVPTQAEADLVVIYAIGRRDHVQRQVDYLLSTGRQYAIVQVCLRSTLSPDSRDWINIWRNAVTVWSYYDLEQALADDFDDDDAYLEAVNVINLYHAPLGVDSDIFRYHEAQPRYLITTSGHSRLSESVRECWLAAKELDAQVAHLGPLKPAQHVVAINNVSDERVADVYSSSAFVSGLRRTEGFELPAAEGLLCGARPIVFDTPDYRWNYRDHAEYIHEGTRAEVVEQLVQLFRAGPRPVTTEERQRAAAWFHWPTIIGGFYERLLA